MPHFPQTPEALLGRNDSKNPGTTCKGITSSGRTCRRALASPRSPPSDRRTSNASASDGVIAAGQNGRTQEAEFYCWQHKVQAKPQEAKAEGERNDEKRLSTKLSPLRERSSIDTLVQKLGIDAVSDVKDVRVKQSPNNPKRPRDTATNDFASRRQYTSHAPHAAKYGSTHPMAQSKSKKKAGFWAFMCCTTAADDDYVEIVRHRKRVEYVQRSPEMTSMVPATSTMGGRGSSGDDATSARIPASRIASRTPSKPFHHQISLPNQQATSLLSLIPQSLPPPAISALLAELVKPISPYDEEGYIYIFWLTPQSNAAPPEATARSLLLPEQIRPRNSRRISDLITEYSFDGSDSDAAVGQAKGGSGKARTIMLKIGRANNITRRMNEWQRQCGYALNLVRWYPYLASSSSIPSATPSPPRQQAEPLYPDLTRPSTQSRDSGTVHKCPHIHRVERLIHLELASKQVKWKCPACGKEHREWFEVSASQAGVKEIDEIVRRWVGWAERLNQSID